MTMTTDMNVVENLIPGQVQDQLSAAPRDNAQHFGAY
jgi:hypothetical protein